MTNCDKTPWETVYFLTANSTWMAVEPETYMLNADTETENADTGICILGIVPNAGDYFLVGDTFLRGFYSVHRMEDMSLGLVPHAGSNKPPLDDTGSVPENTLSIPFNFGGFMRNLFIFAIFYGGWFAGLYYGLDPSTGQFKSVKSAINKANKSRKSSKKT